MELGKRQKQNGAGLARFALLRCWLRTASACQPPHGGKGRRVDRQTRQGIGRQGAAHIGPVLAGGQARCCRTITVNSFVKKREGEDKKRTKFTEIKRREVTLGRRLSTVDMKTSQILHFPPFCPFSP